MLTLTRLSINNHDDGHQRRERVDQVLRLDSGFVRERNNGESEMIRLDTGGTLKTNRQLKSRLKIYKLI